MKNKSALRFENMETFMNLWYVNEVIGHPVHYLKWEIFEKKNLGKSNKEIYFLPNLFVSSDALQTAVLPWKF